MEVFDIKPYVSTYIKRLSANMKSAENFDNISANFNTAIAILTNTVIYNDLPLKVINEFENSINWLEEGDDEEFSNPFITHLNPKTKVFITAFLDDDINKIESAASGMLMMSDIASKHDYKYQICINKEIPKIMRNIKRLHMSTDDVIIMNEESMNTILMMNNHYVQNKFIDVKDNIRNDRLDSTINLRNYQKEYIEYMNSHSKAILKLPCGMGKSIIMIYHMIQHGELSVILVPNVALVDQFYNNILKTYTAFKADIPEIHRLSTKYKETEIMNENKQQIIIAVYNSFVNIIINGLLSKRVESSDENSIKKYRTFPYLYIDEAHHIILPSNKNQSENIEYILNTYMSESGALNTDEEETFIEALYKLPNYTKAFSNLLFMFANKCCSHYAFFSATIEPANFSKYNMFAAIEENYLCKLNVDILIDKNYGAKEIKKETKIENLCTYLEKSEHQSIIIYTSRVETAKTIKNKLKFNSAVITGSMTPGSRQQHFNDFLEKKTRALLTVNCISEGVDLPCADTAIFFDDKHSIINIIQCVGRVMRKDPTKISSTLVIPAYNDDDIDNIYTNILSTINGELGYGSVDIRRMVNVRFHVDSKNETLDIRRNIHRKIYEYNSGFFNKIVLGTKLKTCALYFSYNNAIPSLEDDTLNSKMPDGNYFNLHQFVHDNLYLDNEAGIGLRNIYKAILENPKHVEKPEEELLPKITKPVEHRIVEPKEVNRKSPRISSASMSSTKATSEEEPLPKITKSVEHHIVEPKEVNRKVLTMEDIDNCIGDRNKVLRTKALVTCLTKHGIETDIATETQFLVDNNILVLNKYKHRIVENRDGFIKMYLKTKQPEEEPLPRLTKQVIHRVVEPKEIIRKSPKTSSASMSSSSMISEEEPAPTKFNRRVMSMKEVENCYNKDYRLNITILSDTLNKYSVMHNPYREVEILLHRGIIRERVGTGTHYFIIDKNAFIKRYFNKRGTIKQQPIADTRVLTNDELMLCVSERETLRMKLLVEKLYDNRIYTNINYEKTIMINSGIINQKSSNFYILDMEALKERYLKHNSQTAEQNLCPKIVEQPEDDDLKDVMLFREYLSKGITLDGLYQLINEYYKDNDIEQNNTVYMLLTKQIKKLKQRYINTTLGNVFIKPIKKFEPDNKLKKLLSKNVCDLFADEIDLVKEYKERTKIVNINGYIPVIIKVDYSIPELSSHKQYEKYITNSNMLAIYDEADNFIAYDTIRYQE